MADSSLSGKVAIVGVAESDQIGQVPDKSAIQLHAEAAFNALDEAGLKLSDVDAMFTAAADRGVAFVKGTDFLLEGGQNTLRLAYSGVRAEEIDEGVSRLAEAYRGSGVPAA